MQQTMLKEVAPEPCEGTPFKVCPVCGFENPVSVRVCWKCGYCLDHRLVELEEEKQR